MARTYHIHKYITSPLTTWPPSNTLHSHIPIYTASPLAHTSQYNMDDTLKIHYVTANKLAVARHAPFNIPIYTASPLAHTSQYNLGRHTKYQSTRHYRLHIRHNTTWPTNQKYQATRLQRLTNTKLFSFRLIPILPFQDGVDSTGYQR
jgi:hypothetical protein